MKPKRKPALVKDVFGKQSLGKPTAQIMGEIDEEFEKRFGK